MILPGLSALQNLALLGLGEFTWVTSEALAENAYRKLGRNFIEAMHAAKEGNDASTIGDAILSHRKDPSSGEKRLVSDVLFSLYGAPKIVTELGAGLQATLRLATFDYALGEHGLESGVLDRIQTDEKGRSFYQKISPDKPLPDFTFAVDPNEKDMTLIALRREARQQQAFGNLVHLFVASLDKAEKLGHHELYRSRPVQEAIRGVRAVSYARQEDAIETLVLLGKNHNSEELEHQLRRRRIPQFADPKKGPVAAVCRGIGHVLDVIGYFKDGEHRTIWGLSQLARALSGALASKGYEVSESTGKYRLLEGLWGAVSQLAQDGKINQSQVNIKNWILGQAKEAGLNEKEVGAILAKRVDLKTVSSEQRVKKRESFFNKEFGIAMLAAATLGAVLGILDSDRSEKQTNR